MPQSPPESNGRGSNTWPPPNPGFLAAEWIHILDIGSNVIIDFDAISDENSSLNNTFINFEAEEASKREPENQSLKLQGVRGCLIIFNSAEMRMQKCTRLEFT